MKKRTPLKAVAILALSVGLSSFSQASILVTDTFENRTLPSSLNLSATSGPNAPSQWYWQGANNNPIISEQGGNKFANFSGMGFTSLSFSSTQTSAGRISLSSSTHYQLSYDLLWMNNYAGTLAGGFTVFLNSDNTFANFSSANTQGYLFRVSVTGADTVGWQILQNVNQQIATGTVGMAGVIPLVNGNLGAPIPVQIDWQGNTMSLSINGNTVWNSAVTPFTPSTKNATLSDTTYLQFQLVQSRNQGIDNISLQAIPEPSTAVLLSAAFCLMIAGFRRRRKLLMFASFKR